MELLPHWVLTDPRPAFYDTDSGSAIEQTARVYKAMNDLIAEYNKFADNVNTKITEFTNDTNADYELFKIGLRQEFQDFIDIVNLHIQTIDHYAKNEIGKKVQELYNELKQSNEIVDLFGDELGELSSKIESMSTNFPTEMTRIENDLSSQINNFEDTMGEEHRQLTNNFREEMNVMSNEFTNKVNQMSNELTNGLQQVSADNLYTARIPSFEDIDNTPFKDMIKKCAENWFNASTKPGIVYESLGIDDVDNMAISMNPMLYATRNSNKEFTNIYRDIWKESKAGGTKAMNCITLANMLVMGVSFEFSRFNNNENVIGSMGYGFDVCKYIDSTQDGRTVFYNPNRKLDITTFENILTQASFTETYSKLGLVKTIKSSQSSSDGDIWYDAIKPGDVMFNSSHTMFCLDVETTDTGFIIHYIDSGHNNDPSVNYHTITVTASGSSKTLLRVIRPYYNFYSPQLTNVMNYTRNQFKSVDGPYTGIGAGEDLNTYLIPGEYRCASNTSASGLINRPATLNYAFKLTVENLLDGISETQVKYKFIKQTITVSTSGTIYYRILKCNQDMTINDAGPWKIITATEVTA